MHSPLTEHARCLYGDEYGPNPDCGLEHREHSFIEELTFADAGREERRSGSQETHVVAISPTPGRISPEESGDIAMPATLDQSRPPAPAGLTPDAVTRGGTLAGSSRLGRRAAVAIGFLHSRA